MCKGIANAEFSEEDVTPEMVEAAMDAIRARYLDLENPENLPSLCRDALLAALRTR